MASPAYLMRLGTVPCEEAFALQRSLAGAVSQGAIPDTIVFLEHPPVVTTGRTTHPADHPAPPPPPALTRRGRGLKLYVRALEHALVETLSTFALDATTIDGLTGVWMPPEN